MRQQIAFCPLSEGQGGIIGFAKGGARVRLEGIDPAPTVLHYTVEAKAGGKIAQLGERLIDSTAKKPAGQFFDRFGALVGMADEN
jgi:carbon monoxide dehydrogenase subunit G